MRVYHEIQREGLVTNRLTSTCGHIKHTLYFDQQNVDKHGLMYYLELAEKRLLNTIETILKK